MFAFAMPILLAANTLITDTMTDEQRLKALRPYISPPPGSTLRLADYELRDRKADEGTKIRGFIHFNPPKGTCFTVTRWSDREDDVICKAKDLSFSVKDLDAGGRLKWRISTGGKDFGQEYFWDSPYRVGQVIKAGDDKSINSTDYLLLGCKAEVHPDEYQIKLHFHRNRRWTIRFPKKGLVKPPLVKEEPVVEAKSKTKEPEEAPKKSPNKTAMERWQLDPHKAFWMSATNFRSSDTPPGITGDCYYEFKGAANDAKSGWLECHNTDVFDVVFVHLPCTKDLPID